MSGPRGYQTRHIYRRLTGFLIETTISEQTPSWREANEVFIAVWVESKVVQTIVA
jgi:hypothetical protein